MNAVLKNGEKRSMPEDDNQFKVTPKDTIVPHRKVTGFSWSKENVGFGDILIFTDPETGEMKCESEMMGKDFVKEMLCLMVDKSEFTS